MIDIVRDTSLGRLSGGAIPGKMLVLRRARRLSVKPRVRDGHRRPWSTREVPALMRHG